MFPILTNKDDASKLIPRLSEMVGIKPLFPDALQLLNNLRKGQISSYPDYSELAAGRLFNYPIHMASTMDFMFKLRRNSIL